MHSQPCCSESPIPAKAGIGLKAVHFETILQELPDIGWFEVHSENYLVNGGPLHHYLGKIREHYPLSFHCVGMSPASASGIDISHVKKIRELCKRYQPALISDHLSWSRWEAMVLNDLLPVPYSNAALQIVCNNIDQIQNILGRNIAIENPSTYLQLPHGDMDESDFLRQLSVRTGASILLDVNNVYVSACNHGWSAIDYIHSIPAELVSELHLAGHLTEQLSAGRTLRIDDHGSQVCPEVWDLYVKTLAHTGVKPTLIEWDTRVPDFSVLQTEAQTARNYLLAAHDCTSKATGTV